MQASKEQRNAEPDVNSWEASVKWHLTTQAGPQFAALNGDINFIHLHPIIARLFGFKSNIAHGVFLVSKSIAALQRGKHNTAIDRLSASAKFCLLSS